jgi:antitoxin VapB
MAFNVKKEETDRLVRELTELTGESLTEAITEAVRQRLDRERRLRTAAGRLSIDDAIAHLQSLPVIDDRSPDEILGYDEHGLPA